MQKYLRTYPIAWPVFSTKNYTRDEDGWWNWTPRRRIRKTGMGTDY